jgi:hypothetical protein
MGEVIHFDFNKNRRIPDKEETKEPKENIVYPEEIKKEGDFWLKFIRFIISDKGKKLTNLPVKLEAFSQAQKTVKNYTNEELLGWLENYNENDWETKPSFFRAVYEELKIRLPYRPKDTL